MKAQWMGLNLNKTPVIVGKKLGEGLKVASPLSLLRGLIFKDGCSQFEAHLDEMSFSHQKAFLSCFPDNPFKTNSRVVCQLYMPL